jgi:lysophospholipase L1-like esterase
MQSINMRTRTLLVLALVALAGVRPAPGQPRGAVDFTRYVAVGDGFTAGYQDGALHERSQRLAYPVLVAAAAGTPLALPLVGEPGVPSPNSITGLGLLVQRPGTCEYGEVDLATGRSVGRLDPSVRAANVAVPFQRAADALEARWSIDAGNPNDPDSFEDFVLGLPYASTGDLGPSTQVETAVALEPTFVTVWLGPMDALLPAIAGDVDADTLTPVNRFERTIDDVVDALAATGARGAILNVPDVTSTALLLSQKDLRRRTGLTTKQLKNRLGVFKSSYVPITALPTVDRIAAGQANGPLDDAQVLTKDEMERLQTAVDGYNRALAAKARSLGWVLVDVNDLFDAFARRGVEVAAVGRLTTRYLGGLYGLDGIHPSDTGQALIALTVIAAINEHYGVQLPLPNIAPIAAADPHTCGAT